MDERITIPIAQPVDELNSYRLHDLMSTLGFNIACSEEDFAGVMYDPQGMGPETPFFFSSRDEDPHTLAIARIGVQYKNWKLVSDALKNGKIQPAKWASANVLPLLFSDDDIIVLTQDSSEMPADQTPTAVVNNYGGDLDFYGVYDNYITPLRIRSGEDVIEIIPAEQLGITEEDTNPVWESRRAINRVYEDLHDQAVRNVYRQFPPKMQQAIEAQLESTLSDRVITRLITSTDLDVASFDSVLDAIENEINRLHREKPELSEAIEQHAKLLQELYEKVKRNNPEYRYN